MVEFVKYMRIAISEAEKSLREGNHGFGAVILKDGIPVAVAHDREETQSDPTAHAEMTAIRLAAKKLGKKLSGCTLIATHEPCPMCAAAIAWSGIDTVAYGFSIHDSILTGRTRMNLPCKDVFDKAETEITVMGGILESECSILYRDDVRNEIRRLRNADEFTLFKLNEDAVHRRTSWFQENKQHFDFLSEDLLDSGYRLLLNRFRITQAEAPVVSRTKDTIVFRSMNFCPTLHACRILCLDTRAICKKLNEDATDQLLKQLDKRLCFSRNYTKLRPYETYCEEIISIKDV